MTWQEIVELARSRLPGVEEGTCYGTPALRVRGQLVGRLHDSEQFNIRCDLHEREALVAAHPETFFVTEHLRRSRYVAIRIAQVEPELLFELLEDSWRDVAPKSLRQAYEASSDGSS